MISLILLFFSVVVASGLCSMAEAALLSISFVRARILNEEKHPHARDLLYIKENITYTIAAIVVVNNAVNIAGSIFIGQQVSLMFGNQWLAITSTVLTFTIIIVSEIIPKTFGERYKVPLSLAFAKPLRVLLYCMRPLVGLIMIITHPFVNSQKKPRVTEEEIRMMLQLGRSEGTVEMDEEMLCLRVFKLNDVRAAQIMKPLDRVFALSASKTLGEVKSEIINSRFSRIVVFGDDPLNILGVVQHRALLREIAKDNHSALVGDFISVPIYVNWFTKADVLLEKFQVYHQHLFIVQDSQKRNVGLVTMEDVLEELFGEIFDENDSIDSIQTPIL